MGIYKQTYALSLIMPLNPQNNAQTNQWEACVSKFRSVIPAGPVLSDDEIRELLVDVLVLEKSVKLARSLEEAELNEVECEEAKDELLDSQLHLAVAGAHAYKMAAVHALAGAREQRDLFTVRSCLDEWKNAENMVEAVHTEMMMRARNKKV